MDRRRPCASATSAGDCRVTAVLSAEETARLCAAGAMAPSGGNTQPWRVTVTGNVMRIYPDPSRSDSSFLDVGGYASHIAIGCFAENVDIAARSLGLTHEMFVRNGAVEFTFSGRQSASPHELYEYLPRRETARRMVDRDRPSGPETERLAAVVPEVDARFKLTTLSDPVCRRALGRVLGAADVIRIRNRVMFNDMVREICWTEPEALARRDGIDLRTLELPPGTEKSLIVLRRLPWLRAVVPAVRLAATARSLVADCSCVGCMSTSAELDWGTMVAAGRALQRLWLSATRAGLSLHPWTVSALEVIRLERFAGSEFTARERHAVARIAEGLRDAFGLAPADMPVLVMRLSEAVPPQVRSLRLPWQSFTTLAAAAEEAGS
jgi:hypothetical protein